MVLFLKAFIRLSFPSLRLVNNLKWKCEQQGEKKKPTTQRQMQFKSVHCCTNKTENRKEAGRFWRQYPENTFMCCIFELRYYASTGSNPKKISSDL